MTAEDDRYSDNAARIIDLVGDMADGDLADAAGALVVALVSVCVANGIEYDDLSRIIRDVYDRAGVGKSGNGGNLA